MNIITAYNITRPLGAPEAVDYADAESAIVEYVVERWAYRGVGEIAEAIGAALICVHHGAGLNDALECAANVMRRVN